MFRFLTAGESHGQALVTIVEGVPAGLPLTEEHLARDLARRQGGYGRGGRMAIEQDRAQVLSGVRLGQTIGSPIALLIRNKDWENWKEAMSVAATEKEVEPVTRLRPGHADLAGAMKYLQSDVRPILERASARETAARVAAGAVARRLAGEFGIRVFSHTLSIGGQEAKRPDNIDWQKVEASPVRCADPEAEKAMIAAIDAARQAGDSLGGVFEVVASGVPVGLGSHVHWDRRLDGRIAAALMSINAVKGVEIGAGFAQASLRGSEVHDVIQALGAEPPGPQGGEGAFPHPPLGVWDKAPAPCPSTGSGQVWRRATNRAGGLEGGMSNGEDIVVRAAVKPIPTLGHPLPSVDLLSGETVPAHIERSDVCVVPAAGVVGEAMLSIVLAQALLEKFGGDHILESLRNYQAYLKTLGPRGKR